MPSPGDMCVCGHNFTDHLCDDQQCPRRRKHAERCNLCYCPDFMVVVNISAKQAQLDVETDTVRHNTVDVERRNVDVSDIKAAYRDQFDAPLEWSPWNWRKKI